MLTINEVGVLGTVMAAALVIGAAFGGLTSWCRFPPVARVLLAPVFVPVLMGVGYFL